MIDITKPLELEDGTPAFYMKQAMDDGNLVVDIPSMPYSHYKHTERVFKPDGVHTWKHTKDGIQLKLRNKIMKLVDVNKPVAVGGKEAKIIHVFDNGNLAVVVDGNSSVQNYNQYGQSHSGGSIFLINTVTVTERWINVYPARYGDGITINYIDEGTANLYFLRSKQDGKFQVKQTLHDGVVVSTEVVDG